MTQNEMTPDSPNSEPKKRSYFAWVGKLSGMGKTESAPKSAPKSAEKKSSDYAYTEAGKYNINFNRDAGVVNPSAVDTIGHILAVLINMVIIQPVALVRRALYGIFTCDHKNLGLSLIVMGVLVITFALCADIPMGLEQYQLGLQYYQTADGIGDGTKWVSMVNQQSILVMYYGLIPTILGGVGLYFVPLTIGAYDTAYPRLTALAFWLYGGSFVFMLWALGKPLQTDWILDGHWLSTTPYVTADLLVFALMLWVVSMVMLALVLLVTLWKMRAVNMTGNRIPLFCWGMGMGSALMIVGGLFFVGALALVAIQRYTAVDIVWNTPMDSILYDHFMAVFISAVGCGILLPMVGLASQILATTAKRPVYAYQTMVLSMGALAVFSVLAWAVHLIPVADNDILQDISVTLTIVKTIPIVMITLSWIGTLWGGTLTPTATLIWAKLFVVVFALSQLSHSLLTPLGIPVSVIHVYGVAGIGVVMGLYYWGGKITGRTPPDWTGFAHIWLTIASLLVMLVPMYMLDIMGLPLFAMDNAGGYDALYKWMALGRYGMLFSGVYFVALMGWTTIYGEQVGSAYWGRTADGLEWTVSSPPPPITFERQPTV